MSLRVTNARLPTPAGEFRLYLFPGERGRDGHLALVFGEVAGRPDLLVRVHSECFTGEVLGSLRCDCGPQLADAMDRIAAEGAGIVVYLRQEGRGIGLDGKLRAYNLQDQGHDTVDANLMLGHGADEREYSVAAQILRELGVRSVRLLTNNPAKLEDLRRHGVEVVARVPTVVHLRAENSLYLRAKVRRMRHLLDLDAPAAGRETNASRCDPGPAVSEASGTKALAARLAGHAGDRTGRPFVTLSYAQSVDGSIAAVAGQPLALSGRAALVLTHELRALHDAILVGVGTVLADDPRLTVRLADGAHPRAVVVDSRLRTPPDACLLSQGNGVGPLIAASERASAESERRLREAGAEVVRLPTDPAGRVSLAALLQHLAAEGVGNLMVEGGGGIITSFLTDRLVDHLVLTVAPMLVGGFRGLQGLEGSGFARLTRLHVQQLGDDLVLWGDPVWSDP